jgi:zinc/manganese transport system substrate-binding protein
MDASRYVELIDADKEVDRSMGDVHPGGNPHFYTSPVELFKVSKEIYNRLIQIDPKNKDFYDKNWNIFKNKYLSKLKEWENKISKVKSMEIIEYHESWCYFLKWANLVHSGALEPKPGISPSSKHIMKLLKEVKDKNIKYVIQEVYYPTKLSKLFAKKSGSKLLILPSTVGAFKGIDSIWEKFDYIIDNLSK